MDEHTGDDGDKWEIYQDEIGGWRWRRISKNGQVIGASTEGYANRTACLRNARRNGLIKAGSKPQTSRVRESDTYSAFVEKDKKTFEAHSKKVKDELKNQQNEMSEYQQAQKEIIENLKEKIDGLLPGATSTGLATVFKDLKEKSKHREEIYTKIFCGSLFCLFLITG